MRTCPCCGKVDCFSMAALEAAEKQVDTVAAKIGDDTWEQADALYKPQIAKLRAALEASDDLIMDADGRGYLTSEAAKRQHERNAAVLTDTEPTP